METIKKQFEEVIKYSQGIKGDIKIDSLFTTWKNQKEDFYRAFGNKYIYEVGECTFELDEDAKKNKLDNFMFTLDNVYHYEQLFDFVYACRDSFYNNILEKDYYINDSVIIKKGTKIIKSFKYFIDDSKMLAKVQDKASMLIQENSVHGKLCFSIHPLDYLSSSENTLKWRSCHALDGEFRAGNLSYMVDNSTVVCYLKTDSDAKLPNFPDSIPWNNKKWRMLLHFSNDRNMLFAGRQYPFAFDIKGLNSILSFLPETLGPWFEWRNEYLHGSMRFGDHNYWLNSQHIVVGGALKRLNDLIVTPRCSLNYNDLLCSTIYEEPYYTYRARHRWGWVNKETSEEEATNYETSFVIGGTIECLGCGMRTLEDTESMFCPDCIEKNGNGYVTYCAFCDRGLRSDDTIYNVLWNREEPADWVCENCHETQTSNCQVCGMRYYNHHLKLNKEGKLACRDCNPSLLEESEITFEENDFFLDLPF